MITCPICTRTDDPLAQIRTIAVCKTCAETLYVSASQTRKATFADFVDFDPLEMDELRRARATIAPRNRNPRWTQA